MTELYQSEFDQMNLRRGQVDAELLFDLLVQHGSVEIVGDPSAKEIQAAQKKLADLDTKRQADALKQTEADEKEEAKAAEEQAERDALARKAALPISDEGAAEEDEEK